MNLEVYDHDRVCPKCRFMAGTTDFQPGYHGTPCAIPDAAEIEMSWRMIQPFDLYPNASHFKLGREDPDYKDDVVRANKVLDDLSDRQKAIPEHFDRQCPNCKHLWAERPA